MSERRNCRRFQLGCRPLIGAVCAAFTAFLFLGLPAQADEIEPEPEPAVEPAPEPAAKPAPKAVPAPAPKAASEPDGWRITPDIGWKHGDHRFDLHFSARNRWERWEALTNNDDNFYGVRVRASGEYSWKDYVRVFAEGQWAGVYDLDNTASGAAALYRGNAHNPPSSSVNSARVYQLYAQGGLDSENWLRVGRQALKNASAISYKEGNWKYLKGKRLGQRLVGGVGWTHGERSYDGVSARMEQDGHVLHLYAAEPTTGVFEIDRSYKRQKDVIFGGIDWTVERGTWFENTELGAFFVGFADVRDTQDVVPPFFGDINVYTFGISSLGVYPMGPGNLDVILWGAAQVGSYEDRYAACDANPTVACGPLAPGSRDLDQLAWAGIAEVGYQLSDVWGKPWLRTGVNFASGDSNPAQGTGVSGGGNRNTFFNLLPTNHLYYGYADQVAFSNLIDLLVQFKLSPTPKLGLELVFHQFWLYTSHDARYFGSGAFAKRSLGYGRSPSNGSNNVGQEIDFVVNYKVNKHLGLAAGVAHLFGGGVLKRNPNYSDEDASWAFAQVTLSY
ncbi:MAG: alginate export family protein [Deltaproteobacteria bacterium]|nr:alginate export family protein [Deltaproteobacteria bacterium]